ncbi:MAG: hypothetical protein A3F74_15975 [Betaproteobacteria bacterium RIFCSPLOWO2_12_FULL_62_58]|nr:MAG: hypothetical protein A3I62_03975 [Betaproteobacteria bacterium RIFCSPLOWO2_02_FULL_62_79]OGA51806.1 MAG: hypothetical protein A3F74_15975 [Betaproteobacteria bacterium RIFCSPLOWO2_12_FULL_62_58]
MAKFPELLDRLKRERKINSDNQVAKLLGLSRQSLCDYRKGHHTPDDYALTRIALELSLDPLALIAEVRAETEPDKEKRAFWRDFFRRVGHRALIAPLICGVFLSAGLEIPTANAKTLTYQDIIRTIIRQEPPFSLATIQILSGLRHADGIIT